MLKNAGEAEWSITTEPQKPEEISSVFTVEEGEGEQCLIQKFCAKTFLTYVCYSLASLANIWRNFSAGFCKQYF